ncbi:MAG: efflux RND transporter periplasmic adaptor subunit [Candidatus Eisenbacteria bacterium]|nr:efflux RND transporter periplasmic adaptor subunit [Candidatus Eisenbacteria bacterium]
MKKRMILMLVAVAFFLGAIGFVKYKQIQTAIAQGMAWQPPPEAVTTIMANQEVWPSTLGSIGSVEAVHGVTVSADMPGIVEKIHFQSGASVKAGDLLVSLDTRQERAQLAAAQAQRELVDQNFARFRELREKGVTSQAEFDRADAERKQAEARVGEIQAMIDRKTIRAPFSGTLGIRQVDVGQYVSGGDAIVPLQSLDPIYVNFAVPQQDVGQLHLGGEVEVSSEGIESAMKGTISAINSIIDEATRNVKVQAILQNPAGVLRPGMFVEVQVTLGPGSTLVTLPASAVSYAPYGNSVFIVEDVKSPEGRTYRGVRQQFVKLGGSRGDQVAVLSGVNPGEEVVTSGAFKLRNGAAVLVNNNVQPSNSPAPRPEDS